MTNKLLVFIKSDGIVNTTRYLKNKIFDKFGRKSITICLYKKVDTQQHNLHADIQLLKITNFDDLMAIDFPRLHLLPCKRWISNKSVCFVFLKNNKPIAFSWSHFNSYNVEKVGEIALKDDEVWVGPFFVLKNERGNGLQKELIKANISNLPNGINWIITSVNFNNIASKKSFSSLGFIEGMMCESRFGNTKKAFFDEQAQSLIIIK